MKILLSIVINSLILFAIAYLLQSNPDKSLDSWVILGCTECGYDSILAWKTYILGWIVLGLINLAIWPILKILSIVLFFISWIITFIVNAITLFLLDYILSDILIIDWIWYHINWTVNFIIAVIIFTILNIIYSILFFKK